LTDNPFLSTFLDKNLTTGAATEKPQRSVSPAGPTGSTLELTNRAEVEHEKAAPR
jgi:hypothetical protein